jgi:hypothetical protein
MSKRDDRIRIDDVWRRWRANGVFQEMPGISGVHVVANSAGVRSELQTVTTPKKTTHEVSAGLA